jgi:cell division protein FtsB
VDAGTWIAIVTGIIGLAGVVFTALKFNADRSSAAVQQASDVLEDMRKLNDALHIRINDLEAEIAKLHQQVDQLISNG